MRDMDIIAQLLKKHQGNQTRMGVSLGSQNRQNPSNWVRNNDLPPELWDLAVAQIPGASIEDCYQQFFRDKGKAKGSSGAAPRKTKKRARS